MAFVIPSIFTAVDKFSAPVRAMGNAATTMASKVTAGVARSERLFNRLTPVLSDASRQLLDFAKSAAIAGLIIGGITFSFGAIKDYEAAVASFHTIVGDDKPFAIYQNKIDEVAKDSKKSAVDVALAFEKIAGLNATFAETAEGIGAVSKATIILSRASGEELGSSAESLVGIMNQFNFTADKADRTINVLAAGAGVGAASIKNTAESFVNFGSVASGANITLEQSVGLIQTLGKFSIFGAEAGTKLRGSILKLQQAGLGYKSGQFQINDALEEANKKVEKFKTAKQKDAAILKMFGAENIATGKILLNNISTFQKYTDSVTGTSAASEQAEIRSNTLGEKLDELKAAWINMLTGSDKSRKGLESIKKVISFVAENLDQIISIGSKVLIFFAAWKAAIIVSKAALIAYRAVSSALFLVDMIKYVASTQGLTFAQAAYSVAVQSATGSQVALNAAMLANPIGIVIGLLAALALAIWAVYRAYDELQKQETRRFQQKQALKNEAFSVQDLEKKYLALGKSKSEAQKLAIKESAKATSAGLTEVQTMLKSPDANVREQAMEKLNLLQGKASAVMNPTKAFSMSGPRYANTEELGSFVAPMTKAQGPQGQNFDWLNSPSQKELLNPKEAERKAMVSEMTKTSNAKVDININDPNGRTEGATDSKFVTIKTTSTMNMSSAK